MSSKLVIVNHASLRVGGGSEIFILNIVPYLQRMGFDIIILSPNSTLGEPERLSFEAIKKRLEKIQYIEFASLELPFFKKPAFPKNPFGVSKIIKEADIVYFSNYYLQGLLVSHFRSLVRGKVKFIAGIHSPLLHGYVYQLRDVLHNLYIETINLKELKFFDLIQVMNPDDLEYLKRKGFSNVIYIPYGIDLERFSYFSPKFKDSNAFKVLFVGRLTYQKGIDTLVRAINIVNKKIQSNEIMFYIVGSGPLYPLVKQILDKYDNIKYKGYIENSQLPELLKECHALVMPSYYESFGLVWLEAQASGLPVIVSNISPLNKLLMEDSAEFFEVGDPKSLAQKILKLYSLWRNDINIFVDMSLKARINATKYDIRRTAYKLGKLFLKMSES
jgi:glycosyltransferase involved in cell wall biosynthesis